MIQNDNEGDVGRDHVVDARLRMVEAHFGVRLSDAERDLVRQRIGALMDSREQIERFDLSNGDEPSPIFQVRKDKAAG
jgi:hypothetical protein